MGPYRQGGAVTASTHVAGVRIDSVDLKSAAAMIESAVTTRAPMQVATVNLDFLVRAQTSAALRQALARSELNVADGMPLVWLARLAGRELPGRTAGSDLVPAAMALLAARGARVFLLGGERAVALEAGRRLVEAYPGLVIAGVCEPPRAAIDRMPNRSMVRLVQQAHPDVLLVAFGNPKQELWIARHREALGVSVVIGVGCTLDLIAGRTARAPRWMQATGLEWMFRLGQEPSRLFARYATDALWLARFAARATRERFAQARPGRTVRSAGP
jgi:N-acetylglucosaminyldiphosphoundecaprenol N-acetyl-beta-D-mannosaminyltransferase